MLAYNNSSNNGVKHRQVKNHKTISWRTIIEHYLTSLLDLAIHLKFMYDNLRVRNQIHNYLKKNGLNISEAAIIPCFYAFQVGQMHKSHS